MLFGVKLEKCFAHTPSTLLVIACDSPWCFDSQQDACRRKGVETKLCSADGVAIRGDIRNGRATTVYFAKDEVRFAHRTDTTTLELLPVSNILSTHFDTRLAFFSQS